MHTGKTNKNMIKQQGWCIPGIAFNGKVHIQVGGGAGWDREGKN